MEISLIGTARLLMVTMLLIALARADPAWADSARAQTACRETPVEPRPLSVNFLGVSTIVVRAGDEAIMVDGFFSRPNVPERPFARLVPDTPRIREGLARARVDRLLALLVAQAHHDHGMDAGRVATETGAVIVGSRSTANIARGDGVPSERIITVDTELTRCFGPFRVRVIRSPHSPGLFPALLTGWIRRPLIQSPWVLGYRDRRNFSFLIRYGDRNILVHPSANHPRGGMGDITADMIFLSVGDLGLQTPRYIEDYWDAVVRTSGARLVVPIHWDNFFHPVPPPAGVGEYYGLPESVPGRGFPYAMRRLRRLARRDCVQIRFLEAFDEVPVDSLLAASAALTRECRPAAE